MWPNTNTNIYYSNNIRILFEYQIIRSPLTSTSKSLQINIRAGGSIDAVQVFYGGKPGGHHGGLVSNFNMLFKNRIRNCQQMMGGFFKWHLKPKAHRVAAYQKRIKQLRAETAQKLTKKQTGRKISKPDKNKEDGNRSETCKPKNKQGGHLHRLRLFSGDRIVRVTGRAGLGPGAGKSKTRIY